MSVTFVSRFILALPLILGLIGIALFSAKKREKEDI